MESTESNEIERPRSVAQIIGEALDLYQGYPVLFLTLAVGVIAPYELARVAVIGADQLGSGRHGSVGASLLFWLVDFAVVGPLISALHIHAVVRIGERQKPRLGEVARRGLQVLPGVAAAAIVAGLGVGLGFIALVIPGIVLWLRWAVVAQVAAVERESWIPALTRSRELTRGHYGHIFGLIAITVAMSEGIWIGARAIPAGSSSSAGSVALAIAVRTLLVSFQALTLALLYFDLRGRLSSPLLTQP